jgi:N-acetylneuraminate synthase
MERCALDETEELELKKYVESKGLIYINTFSRSSRTVKKFDIPAYKIDRESNNHP